jgi:Leucine-rich repeat (LRR) protein
MMMRGLLLVALLSLQSLALDIGDIEIMRDSGVKIAFPNERKAHTISRSTRPADLMRVNYIKLNGQSLRKIPKWLPKMINLVKLELQATNMDLIDLFALKSLSNLNTLDLSNNKNLFDKGGSLSELLSHFSLSELYLANTGGSSSNYANIGNSKSLIKLDLADNAISSINALHLERLQNLKSLKIVANKISGTLDTAYLPKRSLVYLNLSHNNISRLKYSDDFPALESLHISMNRSYLEFDEDWDDAYGLQNLKKGSFNQGIALPRSIVKRLRIKREFNKFLLIIKPQKYKQIIKHIYQNNKNYIDTLRITDCINNKKFILSATGEMRLRTYYYLLQSKLAKLNPIRPINYAEFKVNKDFKDILYNLVDRETINTFKNNMKDAKIRDSLYVSLRDYQEYYYKFMPYITEKKSFLLNKKRKELDKIWTDVFTAEEFYNQGFEKSLDKCYTNTISVNVDDHKYDFLTYSLDSHYYMFWFRRYNDKTIQFVHFLVDLLILSMEKEDPSLKKLY